MRSKSFVIIIGLLLCMGAPRLHAQLFTPKVKSYTRDGNKKYRESAFIDAEVDYKKGLEEEASNFEARFNLGNALYQQERWDDAIKQYQQAAGLGEGKEEQALAFHNLGNSFLEKKDFKKAISAYKNALRNNPYDKDTRYNLAYALEQLKNNPSEGNDRPEPSEFAKKLKAQADKMVQQRRYKGAFELMQEGMQKDPTVAYYNDFIGRLKEITGVNTSSE